MNNYQLPLFLFKVKLRVNIVLSD